MKFENWIKEASDDLESAIKSDTHRSDIFHDAPGSAGKNKNNLLPYYLQYRMWISNRNLIWATWFLAIATIILSALTLYFQYSDN